MGKTYEAIIRAEKEQSQKFLQSVPETNRTPVLWDPRYDIFQLAPEWFKELKTRLELNHAGRDVKSILFTSTALQNGCSSVAAGFARCLSINFQKRVLLMDVNTRNQSLHMFFGNEFIQKIEELLKDNPLVFPHLQNAHPCRLQVINCSSQTDETVSLFSTERFNLLLSSAREIFDYIILDSSPIALFPETRILSAKVDGVILIIEAGKTRRQAALRAKKEIEGSGGVFLGSVLNKRKFYIPKWLYRRL